MTDMEIGESWFHFAAIIRELKPFKILANYNTTNSATGQTPLSDWIHKKLVLRSVATQSMLICLGEDATTPVHHHQFLPPIEVLFPKLIWCVYS